MDKKSNSYSSGLDEEDVKRIADYIVKHKLYDVDDEVIDDICYKLDIDRDDISEDNVELLKEIPDNHEMR